MAVARVGILALRSVDERPDTLVRSLFPKSTTTRVSSWSKVERGEYVLVLKVVPTLERDRSGVEFALVVNDDTASTLSDNLTSGSPVDIRTSVSARGKRGGETYQEKSSICQNEAKGRTKLKRGIARIYTIIQPNTHASVFPRKARDETGLTDVLELSVQDVDDRLETVDGSEHDESRRGDGLVLSSDEVDELEEGRASVPRSRGPDENLHIQCRRR